jgi:hypothetical protein
MKSITEKPERVDTPQLVRTRSGHRTLVVLVMVLVLAMTSLGACSSNESTAVPDTAVPETAVPETAIPETATPETAVTAEIDQLLEDYFAAWNAYDADAMQALLTDGFVWYSTNPDPKFGVSAQPGAAGGWDLARTLSYVEGSAQLNKQHLEWVGEAIMTGDGPWLVSRAIHYTGSNYQTQEIKGISTYTIVDEDGTLKLARAIEVGFKVK